MRPFRGGPKVGMSFPHEKREIASVALGRKWRKGKRGRQGEAMRDRPESSVRLIHQMLGFE